MDDVNIANSGAGGTEEMTDTGTNGTQTATTKEDKKPSLSPEVEKLLKSATDRVRNEYGNTIKDLKGQIESLKKDKMSADELADYNRQQREKDISDREAKLLDRENRYFALRQVTELGYSFDGATSQAVVDLVMGTDQKTIKSKLDTFKTVVDSLVKAEVDKTFKQHGTLPKGSKTTDTDAKDTSVASKLGKSAAARRTQSESVLNQYLGKK